MERAKLPWWVWVVTGVWSLVALFAAAKLAVLKGSSTGPPGVTDAMDAFLPAAKMHNVQQKAFPNSNSSSSGSSHAADTSAEPALSPGQALGPSKTHTESKLEHFVDQRVSGLGVPLDTASLHGGWQLTSEVYDRATRHPNATIVSWESPRAVHFKGFLPREDIDHMLALAGRAACWVLRVRINRGNLL
jgi:hypothetical protein